MAFVSEPLLKVKNLDIAFGAQKVVEGVSFDLYKGETLAIVGESGSGKTVTALSLLQLLPYPYAHHPKGSIQYKGEEICGAPEATLQKIRGQHISMIFQEPMTSLNPLHTIFQQVKEVLQLHHTVPDEKIKDHVIEWLHKVGLDDAHQRLACYPHHLSGGQRQRVMIAMALANKPDILIADEPTTALDVTIQAQILKTLKELQKNLQMSIVFITHNLDIVRKVATRVVVMQKGKIVEAGEVAQIFHRPSHPYTQRLLSCEPQGYAIPVPPDAPFLLKAQDVTVKFPLKRGPLRLTKGYIHAVNKVSFTLPQGHTLGIVGESGSGKTTLAMSLLKLQACEGEIYFDGLSLHQLKAKKLRALRAQMQVVFQDPFSSLNPRLSIERIIGEGLEVHHSSLSRAKRLEEIDRVLLAVGLDANMKSRYPHEFSGGQRQRIALARALILNPKLIILDEPTSSLDRAVQLDILQLLKKLQEELGLTYLFISHDLKVIRSISHHVIVMQHGCIVEQGNTHELFQHPKESYTKKLLKAALELEP